MKLYWKMNFSRRCCSDFRLTCHCIKDNPKSSTLYNRYSVIWLFKRSITMKIIDKSLVMSLITTKMLNFCSTKPILKITFLLWESINFLCSQKEKNYYAKAQFVLIMAINRIGLWIISTNIKKLRNLKEINLWRKRKKEFHFWNRNNKNWRVCEAFHI